MIDRAAREELANKLKGLIEGRAKTSAFSDLDLLQSEDRGVAVIWEFGFGLYSDEVGPSRLTGRYAVGEDTRRIAEFCVLFLTTELPYEWPPWFRSPTPYGLEMLGCFALFGLPLAVLALVALLNGEIKGAAALAVIPVLTGGVGTHWLLTRHSRAEEERAFWAAGDREVWPFLRRADYDAARRKQPL